MSNIFSRGAEFYCFQGALNVSPYDYTHDYTYDGGAMLSFSLLEEKFGLPAAMQCLHEIEKAARIRPADVAMLDFDDRLQRACQAQDRMLEAAA
jgi:hypothetical protein